MDIGKGTTVILVSSPNTFEEDWIWDNFTTHGIVQSLETPGYFQFLLGMAFLGGFLCGFFLQCCYLLFVKKCRKEEDDTLDTADGFYNTTNTDDNYSRPPENDHPPDYDTVMSTAPESETNGPIERLRNILGRFLRKKETDNNTNPQIEGRPPSYSVATKNLQGDMSHL